MLSKYSDKPNVVVTYNYAKGGVDHFDRQVSDNSVHHQSKRWSNSIIYAVMSATVVNVMTLYKCKHGITNMKVKDFSALYLSFFDKKVPPTSVMFAAKNKVFSTARCYFTECSKITSRICTNLGCDYKPCTNHSKNICSICIFEYTVFTPLKKNETGKRRLCLCRSTKSESECENDLCSNAVCKKCRHFLCSTCLLYLYKNKMNII